MNDSKRQKAMCVAHSIVTSMGLDPEMDYEAGNITVNGKVIGFDSAESLLPLIVLSIEALASNEIPKIREEANKLAQFLGQPNISFRVEDAPAQVSSQDYEGKALRLTQFKRTLNPPDSVINTLKPIVEKEAIRAARYYARTLVEIGQDVDDLKSIGMIFAVNYWWQYAREKDGDDINFSLFVFNLRQQFNRWHEVTKSKNRSVSRSLIGLPVDKSTGTQPFCSKVEAVTTYERSNDNYSGTTFSTKALAYEINMEELFDAQKKLAKTRSVSGAIKVLDGIHGTSRRGVGNSQDRRRAAGKMLNDKLSALSHDDFVNKLSEVEKSIFLDDATRELARKKLVDHLAGCSVCPQEK